MASSSRGAPWRARVSALAVALQTLPTTASAQTSDIRAAWIQHSTIGPIVRVITAAAKCPRVAPIAPNATPGPPAWRAVMTERNAPDPPDFPDRVCDWQPSPRAHSVAIEGWPHTLRLPAPEPRRIVAFGDSGCLGPDQGQDCNDEEWEFADIAKRAAARQPDLVIHLGDYNYRGTGCVAYDACCTYNPINCGFPDCGDNWVNWRDDFFTPAAPLLAAAPWVMTRGNHELCSRGGTGYFRYLDPHQVPPKCAANPVITPDYTDPYLLQLGQTLRLLVLDSANACGQPGLRDQVTPYRRQFERLADLADDSVAAQTWLVSHKPVWGILRVLNAPPVILDYTLQTASGNRLPPQINLILSGHQHLFQSLTMSTPGAPNALIVGSGGAELDNPAWLPSRLANVATGPGGPTVGVANIEHDHGYLLIEPNGPNWTATFYDRYDQPLMHCDSTARPSMCRAVP
jgi:hypothetical protein